MSAKCDKQKRVNRNGNGWGGGGRFCRDYSRILRDGVSNTVTSFTKSPGCLAVDGGGGGGDERGMEFIYSTLK